ncbi:uncharacterized protein LOC62_05G007755 [Vanrija pseudolonga]|uniref:UBA domain-containing protein n=1 Tax=Vanrija pseudolonga TaxID=143232 RepID=A0AAF0YIJ4_9TREE|nr:hypothetical protein LOC62_05G007755 [Vanrija pseudolonga]
MNPVKHLGRDTDTDTLFSVTSDTSTIVPRDSKAPGTQPGTKANLRKHGGVLAKLKSKLTVGVDAASIDRLVAEGFYIGQVQQALRYYEGDVDAARLMLIHRRDHRVELVDEGCDFCDKTAAARIAQGLDPKRWPGASALLGVGC